MVICVGVAVAVDVFILCGLGCLYVGVGICVMRSIKPRRGIKLERLALALPDDALRRPVVGRVDPKTQLRHMYGLRRPRGTNARPRPGKTCVNHVEVLAHGYIQSQILSHSICAVRVCWFELLGSSGCRAGRTRWC